MATRNTTFSANSVATRSSAELSATLDLLWGGQTKEEKRLRKLVGEALFGVFTPDAWGQMSLEKIERGAKIMQSFRKRCERTKACRTRSWPRWRHCRSTSTHSTKGRPKKTTFPFNKFGHPLLSEMNGYRRVSGANLESGVGGQFNQVCRLGTLAKVPFRLGSTSFAECSYGPFPTAETCSQTGKVYVCTL
jgi:hypothetical protein